MLRYQEYPAPAPLRPHVECVWVARDDAPPPGPAPAERILPDGCVEAIVHLGDPFARIDERGVEERQPAAFLVGPSGRWLDLRSTGRVATLGIRFRPGGAAAFTAVPLIEAAERIEPIESVLGRDGRDLVERLHEAASDDARAGVVWGFLGDRIARARDARRAPDRTVALAVDAILGTRGRADLSRLAHASGLSPRQLERRFTARVGMGPKRLSRIARFQHLLALAGPEPREGWASLAIECGYFDQAHLIRDFREFAGRTPAAFLAEQGEFSRRFTSASRLVSFFSTTAPWPSR